MTLPRETLAAPIDNFRYASPSRHQTPSPPYPDLNAVDKAAGWLAAAENPLIITSGAGRVESDVSKLAQLSERFAIPVVQRKNRYMCLADDHPMHIGFDADAHLESADVIVVLRMRRAVDSQKEGAQARLQDHPHRRRSDLRELSLARLHLRSRDCRRHWRHAAGTERSARQPRE